MRPRRGDRARRSTTASMPANYPALPTMSNPPRLRNPLLLRFRFRRRRWNYREPKLVEALDHELRVAIRNAVVLARHDQLVESDMPCAGVHLGQRDLKWTAERRCIGGRHNLQRHLAVA